MVIQRWQNLLLLIALILMCVFCATPYAHTAAAEGAEPTAIFVADAPVFLIINLVIAALLLIAIFTFKNLKMQIRITTISLLLMCASMVTCAIMLYAGSPEASLIWSGGVLLLLAAAVCALASIRFMRRDRNLLRSYDRLR